MLGDWQAIQAGREEPKAQLLLETSHHRTGVEGLDSGEGKVGRVLLCCAVQVVDAGAGLLGGGGPFLRVNGMTAAITWDRCPVGFEGRGGARPEAANHWKGVLSLPLRVLPLVAFDGRDRHSPAVGVRLDGGIMEVI